MAGHQAALVTLLALELAAFAWFLWPRRGAGAIFK